MSKRKIFLLILLLMIISFGLAKYYQKVKEDKKNRTIINYCEDVRWRVVNNEEDYNFFANFLLNDEVACGDFLYLKPRVKKSDADICHNENSTYYYRTKMYKTFDSMSDCLNSGGRKPYN